MSWQAKGIEKKQSEEKIYKRGASPPFLYSSLFIRNEFILSFVVAMGRFEMLTHFSTPRLQLPLTYLFLSFRGTTTRISLLTPI